MSHADRKPKCSCENPEPKDLSVPGVVEMQMCKKCKGVIE